MGRPINFCAGTVRDILPGSSIDALLVNVPDNGSTESGIKASIRLIRDSKAKIVMVDSGGFQMHMAEMRGTPIIHDPSLPAERSKVRVNLAPEHVIYAARRLKPDIMVALDFPVKKTGDPQEQEIEFIYKLPFNVQWAIETSELRKLHGLDTRLFIPVQCYTLQQLDDFIELIYGTEFDGFSMPIRNLGLREIALFLLRFYQLGIRQVHILGSTSFFLIALSAYVANHLFQWVSLDATTWRKMAQNQIYMNPDDLSGNPIRYETQIDERIKNDCPCPWCKNRTYTYIKNLPLTDKISFLRCHNFWVIENAVGGLYQNATDATTLERYLRAKSNRTKQIDTLCEVLRIVDAFKDQGGQVQAAVPVNGIAR